MKRSPLYRVAGRPLRVAIIMDGNGRWASARGLPRSAGHRAGVAAVRRVVPIARELGIATLTLHAFSSDNWRRPPDEVATILRVLRLYLLSEADPLASRGVRLTVIGRRDRIPATLLRAIEEAEERTRRGRELLLRLAIDYSARDAICAAALRLPRSKPVREDLARALAGPEAVGAEAEIDLLIRTGGEQRLSDFLLWEAAYAELIFLPIPWPDFSGRDLAAALTEFRARHRRFGGLAPEASGDGAAHGDFPR